MSTYGFLRPVKSPQAYTDMPVRWMTHIPFLIGDRVITPSFTAYHHHSNVPVMIQEHQQHESGYQVLRLATELVPATLAIIGPEALSPFWSVLFYFVLILFGIAQQLAIWHCLITGILAINVKYLKSWETTITFFTCACGFVLGLPMATELGIFVVYFLDYVVGGSWWIMLLYLIELIAVFVVRGRPYSGETIVATLFSRASLCVQTWVAPMLSFTWNVILPTLLLVMCVTVFKNGKFRYFFKWSAPNAYDYWPPWNRQLGCLFQMVPILTIPFIAVVQTCRYLSSGPSDIFDRIQLLYRPQLESVIITGDIHDGDHRNRHHLNISMSRSADISNDFNSNGNGASDTLATITSDPPPKYTPPPSYSTATGARIAKLLRQSFRRSVRRLHNTFNANTFSNINPSSSSGGELDNDSSERQSSHQLQQRQQNDSNLPPPPEYATVLIEMSSNASTSDDRNINSSSINRSLSSNRQREVTPNQVATLLRSSFRRAMVTASCSSEQLVSAASPIGHDSAATAPSSST